MEKKMTKKQWISKMKRAGFELYKAKEVERKLDVFYVIRGLVLAGKV